MQAMGLAPIRLLLARTAHLTSAKTRAAAFRNRQPPWLRLSMLTMQVPDDQGFVKQAWSLAAVRSAAE